jgi:hypothetical protein
MKKLILASLLLSSLCFGQDKKIETPFIFKLTVIGTDPSINKYDLTDEAFKFTAFGGFECTAEKTTKVEESGMPIYAKPVTCKKNDITITSGVACVDATGEYYEDTDVFVLQNKDGSGSVIVTQCESR